MRAKICVPAVKGCVLEGKVKLAGTRMGQRGGPDSAEEAEAWVAPGNGDNKGGEEIG
ncbi:MAG: hypothetical protein ACE15F_21620 [bacterium]